MTANTDGVVVEESGHRQLFVINGSAEWSRATARKLLDEKDYARVLWVTTRSSGQETAVSAEKLRSRLGSELDALVFDAWTGFEPDAFGAATGMVRGGGVVLLLSPPLAEWPGHADPAMQRFASWPHDFRDTGNRFLQRLVRLISATGSVQLVSEGSALPAPPPLPPPVLPAPGEPCRTSGQRAAVDAICHVVYGHRRRPLVLTADRGRGKSSALGIAAALLLRQGLSNIWVTAPGLDAVAVVFQQAGRLLPGAECSRGRVLWNGRHIQFVAPDRLIRQPQTADLLLVDEAAAIPVPLLETALKRHARIVFSTTIHGYEGTGRGFCTRFRDTLDRLAPGWNTLHLSQPIRWSEGDPLEQFVFQALLLNASPAAEESVQNATPQRCDAVQLQRDDLLANEPMLSELFGLLVLAHYRTRPGDLRNLLDGPALSIHALLHEGHVVATALVVREGGVDEMLAREVWLGRRRIHGHLLAQSLAVHAGFPEAVQLRYARIMRLAVHPAVQQRGLGARLVKDIVAKGAKQGLDAIGASFGATPELLDFWHRRAFGTVRLGLRREASSGCHAAFMLHPLSMRGNTLYRQLQSRLQEQFPALLAGSLHDLEPEIALRLLQNLPPPPITINRQEWRDIVSFAFGQRGYEVCMTSIRKLVTTALADRAVAGELPVSEQNLLVLRVLQNREWKVLASRFSFQGKRQGTVALRKALRRLLAAPVMADSVCSVPEIFLREYLHSCDKI